MTPRSCSLVALMLFTAVQAWGATDPAGAAIALSRYPAGFVPVEASVVEALHILAEHGGPAEIGLLRNLAEHEQDEIERLAVDAIASIRTRQRDDQREVFARSLPNQVELDQVGSAYRCEGLGSEEAACLAYAELVLGAEPLRTPAPSDGDAKALLAAGKPRRAIAAAATATDVELMMVDAQAREDLRDVQGALSRYAVLAAEGHSEAHQALDRFGVDAERLLLGLQAKDPTDDRVLEVLVLHGDDLTVAVLAERARIGTPEARMAAVEALGRMLDRDRRGRSLSASGEQEARRVLHQVRRIGPEQVRTAADQVLASR